MLQVDTPHTGGPQYAGDATNPNPLVAVWSPLLEGSRQSDARMSECFDGSDAVAELEVGRASIARLRSALMDTLDDMQGMMAGVKQYDRALCTMLARIDRAKAALTHDVAAADSVMERVDRRTG